MKKIVTIFLFVIMSFSPAYAENSCYTDLLLHNYKHVSSQMGEVQELQPAKFGNYNWRLTAMKKIGKINGSIESARKIVPSNDQQTVVHKVYLSAMKSYMKAMDDFEHAVRDQNKGHLREAIQHIKRGNLKLEKLKKALSGESV